MSKDFRGASELAVSCGILHKILQRCIWWDC